MDIIVTTPKSQMANAVVGGWLDPKPEVQE